jgi:hypothetical protein
MFSGGGLEPPEGTAAGDGVGGADSELAGGGGSTATLGSLDSFDGVGVDDGVALLAGVFS